MNDDNDGAMCDDLVAMGEAFYDEKSLRLLEGAMKEDELERYVQYRRLQEFSEKWQQENPDMVAEWLAKYPDLERTQWDWNKYQLDAGYSPYGEFDDLASYAMFKPPEPLHRKSGKRRDTKPKVKPRKKAKLGRRDSRRK